MSGFGKRWSPQGLYLALETSGPVGSVALARGREVVSRAFLPRSGEQSSRILPAIQETLDGAGVAGERLSGVVVGRGPGSFTGVRIAAATAKGLAHAWALPLWAVSSLAAGALSDLVLPRGVGPEAWWGEGAGEDGGENGGEDGGEDGGENGMDDGMEDGLEDAGKHVGEGPSAAASRPRFVLFDARGPRVYAACFRIPQPGGAAEEVVRAHPTEIDALLVTVLPEGVVFAGDGAVRHRERIRAAGHPVLAPPAGTPTADALLHLLAARPEQPPLTDPGRWEPDYLRASSAERERAPS